MSFPTLPPRCLAWLLALTLALVLNQPLRAGVDAEITDEECATFGTQIAELFSTSKHTEAVRLLDTFAFADRVLVGLGMSDKDATEFKTGLATNLGKGLATNLATFSSARYLRIQHVGGEKRALVRMLGANGTVNYFAFIVARRANGSLKWVDLFNYLTGETLTETSRRSVLPLVAEGKKNILEKLTSSESDYVKHFPKLTRCSQLLQQGKNTEVMKELALLPASLQSNRFVLSLRIRATQDVDEEAYAKVITDWEKAFPDDASLDLISIDGDCMRKDFASAVKRIDSLSARIGGDDYLTYLKGNVQMMGGQYAEARRSARAALAAEPTLTSAWDTLLNTSLKEKQFDETVSLLIEFGALYPHADMKTIVDGEAAYEEFRASEAYRNWVTGLQKAKEPEIDEMK
jgi:tetratricopeptide (TPR) repeat protein